MSDRVKELEDIIKDKVGFTIIDEEGRERDVIEELAQVILAYIDTHYIKKDQVKLDEKTLREYLWLSHGHQGMYGDDGEMQCCECAKFGVIDYKRQKLSLVIKAAIKAREEVNLKTLASKAKELVKEGVHKI